MLEVAPSTSGGMQQLRRVSSVLCRKATSSSSCYSFFFYCLFDALGSVSIVNLFVLRNEKFVVDLTYL